MNSITRSKKSVFIINFSSSLLNTHMYIVYMTPVKNIVPRRPLCCICCYSTKESHCLTRIDFFQQVYSKQLNMVYMTQFKNIVLSKKLCVHTLLKNLIFGRKDFFQQVNSKRSCSGPKNIPGYLRISSR